MDAASVPPKYKDCYLAPEQNANAAALSKEMREVSLRGCNVSLLSPARADTSFFATVGAQADSRLGSHLRATSCSP